MNLTQSSNDHEALAALKKANQMLSKKKLLWSELFESLLTYQKPQPPFGQQRPFRSDPPEPEEEEIDLDKLNEEEILAQAFENIIPLLKGRTLEFVLSLKQWFDDNGSLTEKQKHAFANIYEKHW
jgi:hypothetical protein